MATTFVDYTGDGNATKSFSFPSIQVSDVKVDVDGVVKSSGTHYNITNYTTTGGGNVVFTSGNIPASPQLIRIFRDTDVDSAKATYTAGSSVKAADLNANHEQLMFAAQEEQNQTIQTQDIKDAAITTAKIQADAVTGAKIADDQINSEHYVDGSIDTAHIADAQITTAKIVDNAVTMAKLAGGTLPTDITVASANIVDGTIVTADIADSQVTTAKIANSNVTTSKIADGSITTAKLAADSVTNAKIADDSIDSEHYVDGSIDTAHIGNLQVTTDKIAALNVTTGKLADSAVTNNKIATNSVSVTKLTDNAVNTGKIQDGVVTGVKIANNTISAPKIIDGEITESKLATNAVTTAKINGTAVTEAKLASNSVTTNKITDSNVTTDKIANSNITLAKLASDLKQTTVTDDDTKLPTSGAIVDYVAAQLEPFGGFEAIATEVAFPNTQPVTGVVISIGDAGGVVVNGSGTSTTGRTVGGTTVTINNFPASLHSKTMAADIGLMVTSTGSGQVYNYHKILAKEADVEQLSNDINDFAARYRVGASNPTSNNDGGDLFFNTGSQKLLVYNATSNAWEEAQSIGQYFINTISSSSGSGGGSATFNGTATRFTLSNAGAVAEQHIVSINGVVQKPNSGTSAPSEGFVIDGSDILFSTAPPNGADFFIITIGSTVNIGTPSNGTVTAAKITTGAVETAKIADGAVTGPKIADATIALSKLAHGTSSNDGKFLRANNGADPTFESVITDLVNDTSPQLGGNLDTNGNLIILPDSNGATNRVIFGTSKFQMLYDSGNNRMSLDNNTGDMIIRNTGSGGDIDIISSDDIRIRPAGGESGINIVKDAGVGLYHNNVEKFRTTSGGILVFSTDAGGTDHRGRFYWKQESGTVRALFDPNAQKFQHYDNTYATFGNDHDLNIFHNGSSSVIRDNGPGAFTIQNATSEVNLYNNTDNEYLARFINGGAVELYNDGSKKLSTTGHGIVVEDDNPYIVIKDNNTASGNGVVGWIEAQNSSGGSMWKVGNTNDNENTLFINQQQNASIKFTGAISGDTWEIFGNSGHFVPATNNTFDIGTSSRRVRDLYTNDLHLSNEGSFNDMDGTWGNWTIQEGESDLFLKNNRSGKKYKFNLTEVS